MSRVVTTKYVCDFCGQEHASRKGFLAFRVTVIWPNGRGSAEGRFEVCPKCAPRHGLATTRAGRKTFADYKEDDSLSNVLPILAHCAKNEEERDAEAQDA